MSNIDLIDIQFKKIKALRKELTYLRWYKQRCDEHVEKIIAGADKEDIARSLLGFVSYESKENV